MGVPTRRRPPDQAARKAAREAGPEYLQRRRERRRIAAGKVPESELAWLMRRQGDTEPQRFRDAAGNRHKTWPLPFKSREHEIWGGVGEWDDPTADEALARL